MNKKEEIKAMMGEYQEAKIKMLESINKQLLQLIDVLEEQLAMRELDNEQRVTVCAKGLYNATKNN